MERTLSGGIPVTGSFKNNHILIMTIKKNRLNESQSTVKAAKKGVQTTGHSQTNGTHDKFLKPSEVQGGRETTDSNEWREARNASMKGHVTNQGGSSSNSTSTSATPTKKGKQSSAHVSSSSKSSKPKPTLESIKRKAKPKPDAIDLYYRSPEYKARVEKSKVKAEYAEKNDAGGNSYVSLVDMISSDKVEAETQNDPRMAKIAKQYNVPIELLRDVDGDGDIDADDARLISQQQPSNPRQSLATPQQSTEQSSGDEAMPQPDIFTQGADMARSYFNG